MIEAKEKNELPACPVETTLTLIGDKWKVLILRDLMPGTKREYYGSNVPLFRRNGYRQSGATIP